MHTSWTVANVISNIHAICYHMVQTEYNALTSSAAIIRLWKRDDIYYSMTSTNWWPWTRRYIQTFRGHILQDDKRCDEHTFMSDVAYFTTE